MQKILELTEKHFMTGLAPSSQVQDKGLWHKAEGITVIHNPFVESDDIGLLQGAPTPTDLTGSTVVDVPWAWATRVDSSARTLYIWGNSGHLYSIDISGDNSPTDIASGAAVSNPASGLFYMEHSNGSQKVYYFQKTQIGQFDISGAWGSRTDAYYSTNISNTEWHSVHKLFNRRYFCNGQYIGQIEDNGSGGLTVTPRALDFSQVERVNCLNDDGVYLVAGLSQNTSVDNLTHGKSRVIFWDTNASSWSREWEIPDAAVHSIRKVGQVMVAVTSRGLWAFTFSTPPQPLVPKLSSTDTPNYTYPTQAAADVLNEAILFGGTSKITTFGKVSPDLPNARMEPFTNFNGAVSMVIANARTSDLFVGTTNSKLYRVKYDGTPLTSVSAETIYLDLKRWWQIGRIELEFDGQLASGASINIDVQADDLTSSTDWGTASFTSHGAIRTKELYGSKEARKLKLIVNFNGGAPRIRRIGVYGDPIATPTHTRIGA